MATAAQGVASEEPGLHFQDLPKPFLVSLLTNFSDSRMRLALFGTCRGLSKLVVEHCSIMNLLPAVPELMRRPENCAAISRLGTGCNAIRLYLKAGSIPITSDLARSVTHLALTDIPLNSETINQLSMGDMAQLSYILLNYQDAKHRHSAALNDRHLKAALCHRHTGLQLTSGITALGVNSLDSSDVYNTLLRLHPLVADSLHLLSSSQVSALKTLSCYHRLQYLTLTDAAGAQKLTAEEQLQLVTHPTLISVTMPGSVWPVDGPDHSKRVWALDCLELTYFTGKWIWATLPLKGIKKLKIGGVIECLGEEMLISLNQVPEVCFLPRNGYHMYGISRALPVLHLGNCLTPEVLSFVMHRHMGSAIWLNIDEWRVYRHKLTGLAHIPSHVTTVALASWKLGREGGCNWVHVWDHLPEHVSHLVLAQVSITKIEMLALLYQHPAPALKQVTVAYAPGSKTMRWVEDASYLQQLSRVQSQHWGNKVHLQFLEAPEQAYVATQAAPGNQLDAVFEGAIERKYAAHLADGLSDGVAACIAADYAAGFAAGYAASLANHQAGLQGDDDDAEGQEEAGNGAQPAEAGPEIAFQVVPEGPQAGA